MPRRLNQGSRTRRLTVWFLGVALVVGFAGLPLQKATAATEVHVPLTTAPYGNWGVVGVFGQTILLSDRSAGAVANAGFMRTTDAGATWQSAALNFAPGFWAAPGILQARRHLSDGGGNLTTAWQLDAYALATDTVTTSTVHTQTPTDSVVTMNQSTWLFSVPNVVGFQALDLASDARTNVLVPGGVTTPTPTLLPTGAVVWSGLNGSNQPVVALAASPTAAAGPWVSGAAPVWVSSNALSWIRLGSTMDLCTRPFDLSAEVCTVMAPNDGYSVDHWDFSFASYGTVGIVRRSFTVPGQSVATQVNYVMSGSSAASLQVPSGTSWDGSVLGTCLVGDTAYGTIHDSTGTTTVKRVQPDGTLAAGFPTPTRPARPTTLAVTPTTVAGLDNRHSTTGPLFPTWTRPVTGAGLGAETLLADEFSWVGASTGRLVGVGTGPYRHYDRGVFQNEVPSYSSVYPTLSGPYLNQFDGVDTSKVYSVRGGAPLRTAGNAYQFGSLQVQGAGSGPPWTSFSLTDVTTGTASTITLPGSLGGCVMVDVWGDVLALYCGLYSDRLVLYNFRTSAVVAELDDTATITRYFLASGDGYALITESDLNTMTDTVSLWNSATGTKTALPLAAASPVASDGVGHLAYATATDLVWRDFSSLSTSAPRVLGWLASATFDMSASSSWAVEVDTTKALAAGSLVIKDGSGTTVRTLATPASADGSLRLSWDGKSDGGALVPSGTYTYALVANGADGSGAVKAVDGTSAAAGSVVVTNSTGLVAGAFVSVTPSRILDTRFGPGPVGAVAAQGTLSLQVAGQGGVPVSGASAVVLNVTVVAPANAGNITVYPSDVSVPTASNLNFGPGQTVPNLVTVKLGADGKVKVANQSAGTTYLIADVAGYYVAGTPSAPGAFVPVTPSRLLDTRFGPGPVGAVAPQGSVTLKVTGAGGVPASGVGAVVLNVTETGPSQAGNITVYPSDVAVPTASNLNFVPGDTRPNLVTVKVSADGNVSLANQSAGSTHLIVDVAGYYLAGAATLPGMFVPVTPTRLLDTRFGPGPVGAVAAQASIALQITGNAPVPASGVGAVVLNVTETGPSQAGNITVYPSDVSVPTASNLNFVTGDTYPNLTITKVGGTDGKVKLANQSAGTTYLLADVAGYFLK